MIRLTDLLLLTFLKGIVRYIVIATDIVTLFFGITVKGILSFKHSFDRPLLICVYYLEGGVDCSLILLNDVENNGR